MRVPAKVPPSTRVVPPFTARMAPLARVVFFRPELAPTLFSVKVPAVMFRWAPPPSWSWTELTVLDWATLTVALPGMMAVSLAPGTSVLAGSFQFDAVLKSPSEVGPIQVNVAGIHRFSRASTAGGRERWRAGRFADFFGRRWPNSGLSMKGPRGWGSHTPGARPGPSPPPGGEGRRVTASCWRNRDARPTGRGPLPRPATVWRKTIGHPVCVGKPREGGNYGHSEGRRAEGHALASG